VFYLGFGCAGRVWGGRGDAKRPNGFHLFPPLPC
jgi:hypothetical protein